MSDDSDIDEIVCRKGKRKVRVVNDSSSDSDDSPIINNAHRRRRLPRVESDSESSESDSGVVQQRRKIKKMCVNSESSDDAEGGSSCSTDNDSGASSYDDEDSDASTNSLQENENSAPGGSTAAVPSGSGTSTVPTAGAGGSGNWSDSSDGQSEKCPICLLTFKTQDIGSPETCDHTFCVECIQEWSKNVNTCPVDRQEFTLILVRRELNGRVVRRIPVTPKQATDEQMVGDTAAGGAFDLTYCEICGQSDREDRMLLCDGCDLGFHMECLEPPLDTVPVDEWYCGDCSRDMSGPLADTVEIYDGEVDALIMEMEEIGGGRLAPRRRRLLPRTRQSERVRANIENQRHNQSVNAPGPSSSRAMLDNQPSTSSGFDELSPSTNSNRSRNITASTTSRKKPKKRKRRRRRRTTGGPVEYELDEESGVKFALKAKKRRRRKRKPKRLRRTVGTGPKTVKRRLANQLGMYVSSGVLKPKQPVNNSGRFERNNAGIATIDLFGQRNELDYFSNDSDDNEDTLLGGSAVTSILARARPASAVSLRPLHRHKLKTISFPSPPAATTPCDILGSILDQQSKFLSKNAKLSVGENGTILVDADNNSKLPTEQKIDIQSSATNSTTQVPMYPGYGNNGNRTSYGSSSFNNNRGNNSYNRGGGGGNYSSNNYGNNSFRGRGGGNSFAGNNQYDSRNENNRYMDFLHRGPSPYQQSRGGPPFQRGRGAPRFPTSRRSNDNSFQRNNYQFETQSQHEELDLSSSSGSNVQEHEISRSSETQRQPPPDTSHNHSHPDHTSPMMSTTSSYDEDPNNDDLDIYSDIETKDTNETSSPSNEVVESSAPTLVPPPLPPTLPGIVYGSDSDANDSDTELVIDDTDKQDDGYDPAEPSAETDSEPDISTSSTLKPSQPAPSTGDEQIVASTSGEDDGKIIGPQLPDEMKKLLIQEEAQHSLPPVNVVQPRIVHLQPRAINEAEDKKEADDSGDDERCPNMSIYSAQSFSAYEDGEVTTAPPGSGDKDVAKNDNDDCPNFSIYSAESMGVAKDNDEDLLIPTAASMPIPVEAESSVDKPLASTSSLVGGDEPDSVQNDEVESSTTDFEKDSIASLPLPPGPAPPPMVVANSDEEKQEEPDSGVQNAEPDSNNMEKCEPELTDSENENQSEEISTTTTKNEESSTSSSSLPTKKLPVKIDANMKKDLDRKPTSSSMRILQLYDDSDFEEWSEGGAPPAGASRSKDTQNTSDNNVMAEIEKLTEAVSEEEERCYTPCMDEKKDGKDSDDEKHHHGESLGIGGLDTEMVSEDEKNDFDESHEIKTASDGEALEINAKDHELDLAARPEDYEEGEIVEGSAAAAALNKSAKSVTPKPAAETAQEQIILTDDNDDGEGKGSAPIAKDKKKKSSSGATGAASSFKKVSKNTKERNYRDKENRDRSKSKDKKSGKDRGTGSGDKKLKNKKKEKKKELERYDVRNIIGQRAKKDMFGRDETRHKSQSPGVGGDKSREHRSRREGSWNRSSSRSVSPSASRNRRRTLTPPPRRRKSSSRSVSPRTRRSISPGARGRGRRSFSRRRGSASPRRRSLSNHRRSLTPAPATRRRSSARSRSYSPRRNKRSFSRSRSYSPYRPRSTRRSSRSPLHGGKNRRKSRTHSRSAPPVNKNRYRKQQNATKAKPTTTKNKTKKNKKKKTVSPEDPAGRLSLSATPPLHRNIENQNVTNTTAEWGVGDHRARYRRDWTPSWSRSPSPQRLQRSNVQNISTWTPPMHYADAAATALPSSPKLTVYLRNNDAIRKKKDKKKKSGEKRKDSGATGKYGKSKRRRIEQQRTPPPSKEVFASGDNILVSVSFNKANENDANGVTNIRDVVSSSGKRKRDLDGDINATSNKKSKKASKEKSKKSSEKTKKKKKDTSNIKPVAIIDLDKSPFKELTPSPRDVIVLSDSDNGEKEAELMERQEMLREELLEMGSQEENNSVPQSPAENNYTSGPKTPPEPQIKFLIQKPIQLIRNVQNPLHDDQEDDEDDQDVGAEEDMIDPQEELELRLNEVMHKGPNTPPEPPSSPTSSPDVYDPFEPTKSRSASPTELNTGVGSSGGVDPTSSSIKATPPDIAESESSLADIAVGPLEKPNATAGTGDPSPMARVLSILNPKRVTPERSPTTPNTTSVLTVSEQDSQTRTTPEKSVDSGTIVSSNATAAPTITSKASVVSQPPPPAIVKPMVSSTQAAAAYSSQATMMITSTPMVQSVAGQTRNIFNNANNIRNATASSSIPQRIVLPTTANKSSPTKTASASTTKGPIKSTPIKPMQSKTIISKLPLPSNKPYVPSRQLKKSGTVQPQKQNNRNSNENGIEVIDVDLDFESPYSPGSSDFEDLFEPPMETSNIKSSRQQNNNATSAKNTKSPAKNTTNQSAFDSLFGGNSPVYKPSTINNKKNTKSGTAMKIPVKYDKKQKGSGKQVGVKLDEDSLKILDDLPSSAVELQVKNKFLKKLNRQERVVEEVKLVLKPHYNKKHVTKEQYKDILRRSVPKICHNKSGEINPKKIQCLIDAYVRKARMTNRKNSGGGGGQSGGNNNPVQTNSSMPQALPKPTKTFWS